MRESNGQIIDVLPQPVSGFGKVKSSPKDTKSPKRSQKGTNPRIPKSTRSTGKRGGSRKLQHTSPTPLVSPLPHHSSGYQVIVTFLVIVTN